MSNRERWTVYPLIFLTLGIALKDKITRLVNTDAVICKQLLVTDRQGQPRVILASTADGGILETQSNPATVNVVVGQFQKQAGLMFTDANNRILRAVAAQEPPRTAPPPHVEESPPAESPPENSPPPEQPSTPDDGG